MTDEYHSQVMNVSEVAEYPRVAPDTINRLAQGGKIPNGKVGRAWRFHRDAIDHWNSEIPRGIVDPLFVQNLLNRKT